MTGIYLLKDQENKEVAIGILENYEKYGDDETIHFEPDNLIILCKDEDDFIFNKLSSLFDD
jgi:hypothetical protein